MILPTLTSKTLEILLPFVTPYLSETRFSTVAILKTKYRYRLIIEKELRTVISSMIPWFEKICAEKQAQSVALNFYVAVVLITYSVFYFVSIFLIINILYSYILLYVIL